MYCMIQFTDISYPQLIWLIAIPAWVISMVHGARQEEKTQDKSLR